LFGRTGSVQGDWDEISLASVVSRGLECPGRGLGAVLYDALDVTFDSIVFLDALDVFPVVIIFLFDPVVR
jgi:hypothetical protein